MPVCFCYIEKENREVMAMYRGTAPTLEFRLPFETSALELEDAEGFAHASTGTTDFNFRGN